MNKQRKVRTGRLRTVGDCTSELARIIRSTRRGEIPTLDALRIGKLVHMLASMIESHDFEKRLTEIEEKIHDR